VNRGGWIGAGAGLAVAGAVTIGLVLTGSDQYTPSQERQFVPSGLNNVTIDQKSSKAVPQNNTEWSLLFAKAGVSNSGPTSIYPFQNSASPITDVNGVHNLGAVSANHVYQQTITSWSRLGAGNVYTAVDNGFGKQHGTLPDPATNSYLMMGWVGLAAAPTADAGLMSTTDGALYGAVKLTTLLPAIGNSGGESSRGSTALPSSGQFPIALKYDVTNKVIKFYTPSEIINKAYATAGANQGEVDFGVALASGIFAATANFTYGALWAGPSAELLDNDIGAIWNAAGWSPSWYITPSSDSTSHIYTPLAKNQWTRLGIPPPSFTWSFQESSGFVFNDYGGLVGNAPVTLGGTNSASASLAQSVSGWTTKSIKTTDALASQVFSSADTHLPSPLSTSQALLIYVQINAATGGATPFWSWIAGTGTGQVLAIHVDTSGHLGVDVGSISHVTGTVVQTGSVIPVLLVYDKTGSRIILYTKGERIVATYNGLSGIGQGIYFGSNSASSVKAAGVNILWAAMWQGSAAEFTDTGAHNMLTSLGWTGLVF
jgi:hypothetical protein